MAYSEEIANNVRAELAHIDNVTEIKMYGGLAFMVNGKMCVCVGGNDGITVMVRVGKDRYDELMKEEGVLTSTMRGKPIKGYINLESEGQKSLRSWVELALSYNDYLVNGEG